MLVWRSRLGAHLVGRPFVPRIRHVREQQLDHHLLAVLNPFGLQQHFQTLRDLSAATRRQSPLAFDFDHAGAAIAIGTQTFAVTQMRDLDALALSGLPNAVARLRAQGLAIEGEGDGGSYRHQATS